MHLHAELVGTLMMDELIMTVHGDRKLGLLRMRLHLRTPIVSAEGFSLGSTHTHERQRWKDIPLHTRTLQKSCAETNGVFVNRQSKLLLQLRTSTAASHRARAH